MGSYKDGYLNSMRNETIFFIKSWGDYDDDGYHYHMKSFIEVFGDESEGWNRNLHKWLFE
jgi:hypothetical protein